MFFMKAVMQTLENIHSISKPKYRYFPKDMGHLLDQSTKSAGTPFHAYCLLFVDDGAFLFQIHEESK